MAYRLTFLCSIAKDRAVLASFLLNEELGHLGRLGCTLCLIGSLIIVLHAPEDKDIQTVDQILQYAIQPGKQIVRHRLKCEIFNKLGSRLPHVLFYRPRIHLSHGLRNRTEIRSDKPHHLHFDMFPRGLRFHHGYQRLRHCGQTNSRR